MGVLGKKQWQLQWIQCIVMYNIIWGRQVAKVAHITNEEPMQFLWTLWFSFMQMTMVLGMKHETNREEVFMKLELRCQYSVQSTNSSIFLHITDVFMFLFVRVHMVKLWNLTICLFGTIIDRMQINYTTRFPMRTTTIIFHFKITGNIGIQKYVFYLLHQWLTKTNDIEEKKSREISTVPQLDKHDL